VLPSQVVERYLQGVPDFPIDPRPELFTVTRRFLRETYGGCEQEFTTRFPPESNPSSTPDNPKPRQVMYPLPQFNPSMPRGPGRSGVLFATRREMLHDPPWTVFGRVNAKPALWEYLGEYHNTLVGTISGEQFCAQKKQVISWPCLVENHFIMSS
jgi:hypothetical protein